MASTLPPPLETERLSPAEETRANRSANAPSAIRHPSLPEAHRSIPVVSTASWLRKLFAFAGPGYLVAVGYMDPGNWATDLAGGSRFGYQLLSVVLISNLMAMLLQALSAKLGIVTGLSLPQNCRKHFSRPDDGFLSKAEFARLYDVASEVIHTRNPFTGKNPTINTKYSVEEWIARLQRLLSWHRVGVVSGTMWVVHIPEKGDVQVWPAAPLD